VRNLGALPAGRPSLSKAEGGRHSGRCGALANGQSGQPIADGSLGIPRPSRRVTTTSQAPAQRELPLKFPRKLSHRTVGVYGQTSSGVIFCLWCSASFLLTEAYRQARSIGRKVINANDRNGGVRHDRTGIARAIEREGFRRRLSGLHIAPVRERRRLPGLSFKRERVRSPQPGRHRSDRTHVRVIAVPGGTFNQHRIEGRGRFGRLAVEIENVLGDEPADRALVYYSSIAGAGRNMPEPGGKTGN